MDLNKNNVKKLAQLIYFMYICNMENKNKVKECKKCLEMKSFDSFYNAPKTKDRKQGKCKECMNNVEYKRVLRSKYIYCVINRAWSGWVKVGQADNVDERVKKYNTGSPMRDYECVFKMKVSDIYYAEKNIYNKYNMTNEWTKSDWNDIKKDIIEYENGQKK